MLLLKWCNCLVWFFILNSYLTIFSSKFEALNKVHDSPKVVEKLLDALHYFYYRLFQRIFRKSFIAVERMHFCNPLGLSYAYSIFLNFLKRFVYKDYEFNQKLIYLFCARKLNFNWRLSAWVKNHIAKDSKDQAPKIWDPFFCWQHFKILLSYVTRKKISFLSQKEIMDMNKVFLSVFALKTICYWTRSKYTIRTFV